MRTARASLLAMAALLLSGLPVFGAATALAQPCKPLLLPGKRTLFQRVITHPGAELHAAADAASPVVESPVKPFTVFYIYERVEKDGTQWLRVGPSSSCEVSGWLQADKASEWRQALTLVFTERSGRQPVLFFKDLKSLETVAGAGSPGEEAAALAQRFAAARSSDAGRPADLPVVAMEPAEQAVSRERFYLMPIFQTVQLFEGVKFLQVASIDPGNWQLPVARRELRTAIVFVIDTTISMKPYIQRTRRAVRRIYDAIEQAGLADKVAFGLVAFRNSTEKTPGLEYVSKVMSGLRDGTDRQAFEQALEQTREARVSTQSFNEDAFAGIKTALDEMNWGPYQSRIIFLITDAGAIRADDPWSSTGLNEREIADMAESKGVKIFALHIRTPLGRKLGNISYAESQYKVLTGQSDPTLGNLYVPIDATEVSSGTRTFGRVVEKVATQMVRLVEATGQDRRLQLPARAAGGGDVVADAERKAAILGYAMQLDFLGQRERVRAPHVVTSWVSDMDLARPDIPAFKVTVLLTKNQLSDLYQRLKVILDQAQRTKRTGARDFFQGILSAAARISRDPNQFSLKPAENLRQMGLLGEFLDDLPYRSDIMRLTEEDWYRMSVGEQQALIDDLKLKLKRYRQYHDDVANWTSFGASDPGDSVYRVPLSMMP